MKKSNKWTMVQWLSSLFWNLQGAFPPSVIYASETVPLKTHATTTFEVAVSSLILICLLFTWEKIVSSISGWSV